MIISKFDSPCAFGPVPGNKKGISLVGVFESLANNASIVSFYTTHSFTKYEDLLSVL